MDASLPKMKLHSPASQFLWRLRRPQLVRSLVINLTLGLCKQSFASSSPQSDAKIQQSDRDPWPTCFSFLSPSTSAIVSLVNLTILLSSYSYIQCYLTSFMGPDLSYCLACLLTIYYTYKFDQDTSAGDTLDTISYQATGGRGQLHSQIT